MLDWQYLAQRCLDDGCLIDVVFPTLEMNRDCQKYSFSCEIQISVVILNPSTLR